MQKTADAAFSTTLTFSEFPVGTTITDQYEPEGVLFAGPDSSNEPFIADDGANPTSPTLSGSPLFTGNIYAEFVIPGTTTPTSVNGLSVDVGYIDNPGSTQVDVYSASGVTVLPADQTGIDLLTTDVPDIYGFKTEETESEPAGYEIDNLSFTPGTTPAPGVSGTPVASESFGGSNPAEPACQCSFGAGGDPVNTSTGNFWHTWTDVKVPGSGPSLDLSRTYNSLAAGSAGLFGNGWSFPYDAHLDIDQSGDVTVVQGNGAEVPYTLTGVGLTAPSRVTATLAQNADGSYTFTTGNQLTYDFTSSGQLTSITDLNGYTATVSYPSADEVLVTDPSGRTLTFALSGGRIVSATDPAGNVWTYTYDGSGNLTGVTDPLGRTTTYSYDSNDRMASWTDPRGETVTNAYDDQGRVVQQTDPMGSVTKFDYTSVPKSTIVTDPDGNETLYTYESGVLGSETQGYGSSDAATWGYTYDPTTDGQATITDPDGGVTTKTYDPNGNVLTVTDTLGNVTTYTYNDFNEPASETDPLGTTTTYAYDSDGNLLSKAVPLTGGGTATWSYTYGSGATAGDMISSTDPNGNTTTYGYDSAGDQTSITDPEGNETTETYDPDGRLLTRTTPTGGTTRYAYDQDGELEKVTDPLGKSTSYVYDADGNQTSVADANGHETTYSYDADNEQTQITNPDGSTSKTSYDANGNVLSQADGNGNNTNYTYGPLGQVATVTDPDGHKTSYTYDGDGNQLTAVDPSGRTTTYAYDADDRVTGISYSDGVTPDVTESYDADGDRTSLKDGTGTSTFVYHTLGQLTSETNGAGETISYTYDSAGNVTSIHYPNGQTVDQAYNDDEQLKSVTDWLGNTTSFGYDADGNETSEDLPGSVSAKSTYNADDELSGITDANSGGTLASFGYARDADGQVTTSTTTGAVSGSDSYSYDKNNRLTADNSTAYGYDQAGNPTTYRGQPQTFDPADELQTSGPQATTTTPTTTTPTTTTPTQAGKVTVESVSSTHTVGASGTLSTTVTAKQNGDLLLVFLSAGGPTGSKQSTTAPKSKGMKWGAIVERAAHGGLVGAWKAYAARKGRLKVTIKLAKPTSQALLTVVAFHPGDTVGAHAARASTTGESTLKLHDSIARSQVWAVGHDASSGAAPKPIHGQRLSTHLESRKHHEASWTQDATITKAAITKIGERAPTSKNWLLAAVIVKPLSTATTDETSDLLTDADGTSRTFTYNAEGDRTSVIGGGSTVNLGYDQANRLTSVSGGISYSYDGDGLRTSKTVNGTATQFAWDGTGSLPLLLQDGSTYYIYGPGGQPIEQISRSTPDYFLADQQGSTRLLTDSSGNVVGTYSYDPWGTVTSQTGTATTNLQYDGQYTDPETGYEYLRARYYDPSTGQFLAVDPAASETHARYAYADDTPVEVSDPTGRYAIGLCTFAAASVAVGVGVSGEVETCSWHGSFQATTITPIVSVTVGGSLGVTGGAAIQYSSALQPEDLEGPGCSVGASGQAVVGVEGSVGSSCTGHGFSAELGAELGADGSLDAGVSVGATEVIWSSTGYFTDPYAPTGPSNGTPLCVATLHESPVTGIPLSEPTLHGIPLE